MAAKTRSLEAKAVAPYAKAQLISTSAANLCTIYLTKLWATCILLQVGLLALVRGGVHGLRHTGGPLQETNSTDLYSFLTVEP